MKTQKLQSTANLLDTWFDSQNRALPWRQKKPDPYKVWISEIMLQQTTSAAVKPFYENFINKWPTVNDLAQASLDSVYEAWAGLGYYSRARNLLKAAQMIEESFDGSLPKNSRDLLKLPGIGPYTSAAISSICFNEKIGVVDGNVLRVYNRLIGEERQWWKSAFFKETQNFSTKLCELSTSSSKINQALMDLGATICTPTSPKCMLCPIKTNCLSFKKNLQSEIPLPKPRKKEDLWVYEVYKIKNEKSPIPSAFLKDQPVLKNHRLPMGQFLKVTKKPKDYSFQHSITNNKIYVRFKEKDGQALQLKSEKLSLNELNKETPSSLVKKIWQSKDFYESIDG